MFINPKCQKTPILPDGFNPTKVANNIGGYYRG